MLFYSFCIFHVIFFLNVRGGGGGGGEGAKCLALELRYVSILAAVLECVASW